MLDTVQEFRLPQTGEAPVESLQPPAKSPTTPSFLVQIYPLEFSKGLIPAHSRRPITFGRSSSNSIELVDEFVSREHAVLEWNGDVGTWEIRDCGSRNGTYVNDRLIERAAVPPCGHIRIGGHIFKFLSADHVETQYHETVYQMMTVDALTQVHNRRYFEDGLEREVQRAIRFSRPLALILFDLDRFKIVNDRYGHLTGDEVLQAVCQRVRRRVRKDELFARYGGEEFAIVLAETSVVQAKKFAEELRALIADEPIGTSQGAIPVTMSLGIAHTEGVEPVTSTELMSRADERLYEAKDAGRNCVKI